MVATAQMPPPQSPIATDQDYENMEFDLPVVKLTDAELSEYLTQDACTWRRKMIMDAILLEMALERADYIRIHHRHTEKANKILESKAVVDQFGSSPTLSHGTIIEMEMEQLDDEEAMESTMSFADALRDAAVALSGTFPDDGT